jgi:hypothetical protein
MKNWLPESDSDYPQYLKRLDATDSVADAFQNLNQTSAPLELNVFVKLPARGKWQDVNSHSPFR